MPLHAYLDGEEIPLPEPYKWSVTPEPWTTELNIEPHYTLFGHVLNVVARLTGRSWFWYRIEGSERTHLFFGRLD